MTHLVKWRAATMAAAVMAAAPMLAATAAQASAPRLPQLKLIAAQRNVQLQSYGNQVAVDPGIWLASLRSDFRLNVSVPVYGQPPVVTEVIGGTTRQLPSTLLDGFNGLKDFVTLTLRDSQGKIAYSQKLDFCPGSFDAERVSGNGPFNSPYPQQCSAFDPFSKGEVWGLSRGWAIDPAQGSGFVVGPGAGVVHGAFPTVKLPLGTYQATETISAGYTRLFGISTTDATASDTVSVVKGRSGALPSGARRAAVSRGRTLAQLPASVRTLAHPPASSEPDLVALPAWGISASATRKPATDQLNFGATVWIGGNAQLDVEGFRSNGSTTMPAYQYFFRNGKVIGRIRAGTMGFDSKRGHDHWHFQQFAQYRLLNSARQLVQDSGKIGFCIAPTDAVDMLLPRAVWQPSFLGFSGQCGSPTALWVREQLPLGWGDTYQQQAPGQSFDITNVPNGTYYIEVIANPLHVLHEISTANNVSLRQIIISGTAGHRHIKVPAWNGIDPEG